jgi:NodT family efflux transporter outer membrane factor (OMF) lipoprotein
MKNSNYIIIAALAISFLFMAGSCKSPQAVTEVAPKPLPESFGIAGDTASAATTRWNTFYTDQHLIKLIDTALVNNADIMMALQRIKAVQADIVSAKGALLPNISLAANAGLTRFGDYTMDGAGNRGTEIYNGRDIPQNLPDYFVGLQTSWELDIFGKLKNQKKAALARAFSSEAIKNVVVTNLIAEIANQYYELLSLDQSVKIIDKNIAIQENAAALMKVMKNAAAANELAVKQSNAQVLNIKARRFELLQQITETENNINFLTGSYPKPIERDTLFSKRSFSDRITTGIPSALLQNRPDIKVAEYDLLAAKADVKSAKAYFYPSLNISGAAGYQAFRPDLLLNPQSAAYTILGGLTAPLVNRAAIKATFTKANANQVEAMYNYHKTIMNGYVEVSNELARISNLENVFALKSDEVKELNNSIGIVADLFRFGRANYFEVLIVQQNALEAELDLVNTKKQQLQSSVNIYKALGGGWRN